MSWDENLRPSYEAQADLHYIWVTLYVHTSTLPITNLGSVSFFIYRKCIILFSKGALN